MRDAFPECGGVIELSQVTELVNNNVVNQMWWKERNTVVEVEIACFGATTPTCSLIPDTHSVKDKTVVHIEFGNTGFCEFTRL